MTDDTPPIPPTFGFRYIGWWIWCHLVFLLSIGQGIFASVLLLTDPNGTDPNPTIPHNWVRWIILGNAIFTGVLAKIERKMPTA